MTEDVYVNTGPDLTKKVRFVRREREMEMEERGEPIDDIYVIPDDQDHIYVTPDVLDPGPQQEQQGGKFKTNDVEKKVN